MCLSKQTNNFNISCLNHCAAKNVCKLSVTITWKTYKCFMLSFMSLLFVQVLESLNGLNQLCLIKRDMQDVPCWFGGVGSRNVVQCH